MELIIPIICLRKNRSKTPVYSPCFQLQLSRQLFLFYTSSMFCFCLVGRVRPMPKLSQYILFVTSTFLWLWPLWIGLYSDPFKQQPSILFYMASIITHVLFTVCSLYIATLSLLHLPGPHNKWSVMFTLQFFANLCSLSTLSNESVK